MKWFLVAALALLPFSAAAQAIDIQVDNFTAQRGISELVLKVTNNTGADVESLFIDCAFLREDGRAIDIGKVLISTLAAGEYAYDKASIGTTDGVSQAECRVVKFR